MQSFSRSTTNEKIRVLNQYPEQKLDVVVIHDGTNLLLKHKNKELELVKSDEEMIKIVQINSFDQK